MAKLLKLRRGSTSQHGSFTGAEGEVTVDTDKDVLVVHDGSTAGGHPLAAQDMDNVPAGSILGTQLENSGVTAGQYGSSSAIPIVTVDAQGLVTAASTTAIDSTTISNGSASVAVASNGPITSNANHDFSAGIDVTGNITQTSGSLTVDGSVGDTVIGSSGAEITFTRAASSNITCSNASGSLIINTGGSNQRMSIASNGQVSITEGLTVSKNIETTSSSQYPLNINGSNNGKIIMQGSSEPYIRFREGTTDKAYLQWNSNGYIVLANEETGDYLKVGNSSDGLEYVHDGTTSKVWHAGNDGAGSGLDADTLDGISSGSFLRSDTSDDFTGATLNINSSTDQKLIIMGSQNPYIHFREGSTDKAYIQWNSNGSLYFVNQESGEQLLLGSGSNGLQYVDGGSAKTVWHSGNDGPGSGLNADLFDDLGSSAFLRADAADTATADITFSGGAAAITVAGGSDIRLTNGNWTGDHNCKIQHYNNSLYLQGGTGATCIIFRDPSAGDRWKIDENGNYLPGSNNQYDIGSSSNRVKNIYTNDLHLSNEGHSNDVDGTWGNWTIQEGESDLFLKNNRSGKKYKFSLTEVS